MAERLDQYDESLLLGYLESELTPEQRRQFEQQMAGDARLRSLVGQLVQDKQLLRRLEPVQAPAEVMDRANQVLERQMLLGVPSSDVAGVIRQVRWTAGRLTRYAAVAAIVLLCGSLAVFTVVATLQTWPRAGQQPLEVAHQDQPVAELEALPPAVATTAPAETLAEAAGAEPTPTVAPAAPALAMREEPRPELAETMAKAPGGRFVGDPVEAAARVLEAADGAVPVAVEVVVVTPHPQASLRQARAYADRLELETRGDADVALENGKGGRLGRLDFERMETFTGAATAVEADVRAAAAFGVTAGAEPADEPVTLTMSFRELSPFVESLRRGGAQEVYWTQTMDQPTLGVAGDDVADSSAGAEAEREAEFGVVADAEERLAPARQRQSVDGRAAAPRFDDWSMLLRQQLPLGPMVPVLHPGTPLQVRVVARPPAALQGAAPLEGLAPIEPASPPAADEP